jgi:mRNA interferase MazF
MKQREIWYANLDPVKGSEQKDYRPVVIISGDMLNSYLPIVIACPLTTKVKSYKGNVILESNEETGLLNRSEILTFHIRSISKERLVKKVGSITMEQLLELKQTLNDILRY